MNIKKHPPFALMMLLLVLLICFVISTIVFLVLAYIEMSVVYIIISIASACFCFLLGRISEKIILPKFQENDYSRESENEQEKR